MTQTPKVEITLNAEALDNILTQSGIRYWCEEVTDIVENGDKWLGYTVTKHPDDPDRSPYEVTLAGIENAISEVIMGKQNVNDYYRIHITNEYISYCDSPEYGIGTDVEMNDILIQIAAFGKVIYG